MDITIWAKIDSEGNVVHNHIELGIYLGQSPIPGSPLQIKSWTNQKWVKSYGFLISNKVQGPYLNGDWFAID